MAINASSRIGVPRKLFGEICSSRSWPLYLSLGRSVACVSGPIREGKFIPRFYCACERAALFVRCEYHDQRAAPIAMIEMTPFAALFRTLESTPVIPKADKNIPAIATKAEIEPESIMILFNSDRSTFTPCLDTGGTHHLYNSPRH